MKRILKDIKLLLELAHTQEEKDLLNDLRLAVYELFKRR